MDPKFASTVQALAMAVIALFVVLAYFNGWG
jgi:hypothetical protein